MTIAIEQQIRPTPRIGSAPYRQVHAHSTGNPKSTAQNESTYMGRKDLDLGYYTHVVGNGRVIQTAAVNRGAWDVGGDWNAETYAAVELIESHATQEEFERDYRIYVNLLRQLAQQAGLPTTLDQGSTGILTHAYCTANQPGNRSDHIDPYPYLAKRGITKEQFAKDLAQGFGTIDPRPQATAQSMQQTSNIIKQEDDDMSMTFIKIAEDLDKKVKKGNIYLVNAGARTYKHLSPNEFNTARAAYPNAQVLTTTKAVNYFALLISALGAKEI